MRYTGRHIHCEPTCRFLTQVCTVIGNRRQGQRLPEVDVGRQRCQIWWANAFIAQPDSENTTDAAAAVAEAAAVAAATAAAAVEVAEAVAAALAVAAAAVAAALCFERNR